MLKIVKTNFEETRKGFEIPYFVWALYWLNREGFQCPLAMSPKIRRRVKNG